MAGPMTAFRCYVTSVQVAQVVCPLTIICLPLVSGVPYLIRLHYNDTPAINKVIWVTNENRSE